MYEILQYDFKEGSFFGSETATFEAAKEEFNKLLQIMLRNHLKKIENIRFDEPLMEINEYAYPYSQVIVHKERPYCYLLTYSGYNKHDKKKVSYQRKIIIREIAVNELI